MSQNEVAASVTVLTIPPTPQQVAGRDEDYTRYQKLLPHYHRAPDRDMREAAVDVMRLGEPVVAQALSMADIVLAYDGVTGRREVAYGADAWREIMDGTFQLPYIIVAFYCLLDSEEYSYFAQAVEAAKGATCDAASLAEYRCGL